AARRCSRGRSGGTQSCSRTITTPSSATTSRRSARSRAWLPNGWRSSARRARRWRRRRGSGGPSRRRGPPPPPATTPRRGAPPRLEQLALADFLERGELDRHLRRLRLRYRRRRDALVDALGAELPHLELEGVAAGMYVVARLPDGCDEAAALASARARRIAL